MGHISTLPASGTVSLLFSWREGGCVCLSLVGSAVPVTWPLLSFNSDQWILLCPCTGLLPSVSVFPKQNYRRRTILKHKHIRINKSAWLQQASAVFITCRVPAAITSSSHSSVVSPEVVINTGLCSSSFKIFMGY